MRLHQLNNKLPENLAVTGLQPLITRQIIKM